MGIMDRVGTGEFSLPTQIDPDARHLRDEFLLDPFARHGTELQLVLGAMRSNRDLPRFVLLVTEPGRAWRLAIASRERGMAPSLVTDRVFTDLADVERYVFDLRWRAMTEEPVVR
jgi:hypothetical protein